MKVSSWAIRLSLLSVLLVTPACSHIVANSGISSPTDITDRLSRQEVQDRYGTPVSSTATPAGRQVEIYRLRKRLDTVFTAMSDRTWQSRRESLDTQEVKRLALYCVIFGPGCFYIVGLLAVNETFSLPVNLVRSQMSHMQVGFVFGSDDRLLYLYDTEADPPIRFGQAIRTLQHPLASENDAEDATTLTERLTGYIAEARQRAEEVRHVFTEHDEQSLGEDLQTAENIDAGIIAKEEATAMRPSKFLAAYNL